MHTCVALRARWVLPIVAPPIENGVISVAGGRIVAVGANVSGARALDLGDVAVLPGCVNTHTHLEFSDLQRPLGTFGAPFVTWLRAVVGYRRAAAADHSPEGLLEMRRLAISKGMGELRQGGCVAVGEIATAPSDPADYRIPGGPDPTVFLEALGLGDSQRLHQQAEQHFQDCRQLSIRAGTAPHAPYTVSLSDIEHLASASARCGLPLAFHLAESIEELELLSSHCGPLLEFLREMDAWRPDLIPRGIQPADYLKALSKARRALIIHGNFLGPLELVQCAEWRERLAVVYCPRTHARLIGGNYPLAEMLRNGVMVAIGTDSRASNPDLCMLSELRFLAAIQPQIAPSQVLVLGTLNGARALGIEREFGAIRVGHRAAFIIVPTPSASQRPEAQILGGTQPAASISDVLGPEPLCHGGWITPAEAASRAITGERETVH